MKRFLTIAGVSVVVVLMLYYAMPFCLPAPDIAPPPNTLVTDRHGQWLGYVPGEDGYRCQPLSDLPPNVVKALLAAEDKRFYSHGGVDAVALARATWQQLTGQGKSGASTISMQVAKMYSPPSTRNLSTKLREMLQARRLEMTHSKEELLLAYLNRADFSNLCRGVETAAHFYFGKGAAELNKQEAALLVALVKSPTKLNPLRYKEAALRRCNIILARMGEKTVQNFDRDLGVAGRSINAPPVAENLAGQLTIDRALQAKCASIACDEVAQLRKRNVSQAAVVVVDNRSGEVLAAVPTALPHSMRGGAMNGTTTPRSAGSTLKPFVYLMAFRNGAWPGTVLADVPTLYHSADGVQAPRNYNDKYLGPITIRQALACSQNIPAMEALHRYGSGEEQLQLLRSLGFRVSGSHEEYGLGLAIGNAHITLMELVQAYSTIARLGAHIPLHTRLPHTTPQPRQLLRAEDCYRIADILSDKEARAVAFGSAPTLSFPFRVAAKTGTSSNFRDNWCVGFTAEYTVGVWVGNFDHSPMHEISGVSGAGPIFNRVFRALHAQQAAGFPQRPPTLQSTEIDIRTGGAPTPTTPNFCRKKEWATTTDLQHLPQGKTDDSGRIVLDARYTEWYRDCHLRHIYCLQADADTDRVPAVLIPAHGSTLTLSPNLPDEGRVVELQSTLPPTNCSWHSDTLPITCRNGKWYATLTPGVHSIRVSAPPYGHAQSTFQVILNHERPLP